MYRQLGFFLFLFYEFDLFVRLLLFLELFF